MSDDGAALKEVEVEEVPEEEIDVDIAIPESPLKMEEAEKYEPKRGEFSFSLSRPTYTKNAVVFVYAMEGETYASLAEDYDLFYKEILSFNDLSCERQLLPGDIVYIQRKKTNTPKGLDMHIVESDETLWEISQRYGVRLKNILKFNNFPSASYTLAEGDRVLLRKK